METQIKWYQKTWGILALILLVFPLGLYLMWKYARWNITVKWAITGLFVIGLISNMSRSNTTKGGTSQTSQPSPTPQIQIKDISYEVVKTWEIPNGGYGKVIVISPDNFNEEDVAALGEKLKKDTKNDRNAFVYIFTDRKAAEMRDRLFDPADKLSSKEEEFYDAHYVGDYVRNINSGYHQLTIYFDGVMGTNNKTFKY